MELAENQIYIRDKVITPYVSNPKDEQKLIEWLIRDDTKTQTKKNTRAFIHDLSKEQIDSWDADYKLTSCSQWEATWKKYRVVLVQDIVDEGYSGGQADQALQMFGGKFENAEAVMQAWRDTGATVRKKTKLISKQITDTSTEIPAPEADGIPVIPIAVRIKTYLKKNKFDDYTCHQLSQALDVDNRIVYAILMQLTSNLQSHIIKTTTPTAATDKKPASTKTLYRFYPCKLVGGEPAPSDAFLRDFIYNYLKVSDYNAGQIAEKARWFFGGIRRDTVLTKLREMETAGEITWHRKRKNSKHYLLTPIVPNSS